MPSGTPVSEINITSSRQHAASQLEQLTMAAFYRCYPSGSKATCFGMMCVHLETEGHLCPEDLDSLP